MIIHQFMLVCSLKKSTTASQIGQCKTAHGGLQDLHGLALRCVLSSSPSSSHIYWGCATHSTTGGLALLLPLPGTLFVLDPHGLLPCFLLGLLSPYSSGYYLLSTRPRKYFYEGRQTVCLVLERVPDTPENSVFVG